jgi:hypothetical protein
VEEGLLPAWWRVEEGAADRRAGPWVNGARGAGRVLAAREEGEGRGERRRKGKEKKEGKKERRKGKREERKEKEEKKKKGEEKWRKKRKAIGEGILENLENC